MSENTSEKKSKNGVGKLAIEMIKNGFTNEEVLETIKEKFPKAKTTMASVNWYRNKLRGEGANVLTSRELKRNKRIKKAEELTV